MRSDSAVFSPAFVARCCSSSPRSAAAFWVSCVNAASLAASAVSPRHHARGAFGDRRVTRRDGRQVFGDLRVARGQYRIAFRQQRDCAP